MRMKRSLSTIIVLALMSLVPALWAQEKDAGSAGELLHLRDIIPEAMSLIQKNYVEPVDTEKIAYGALQGMMNALDPQCQFLPPAAVESLEVATSGTLGGLGIEITKKQGFVTVVSPIVGTPAHRAGLLAGDRIVKINDEVLRDPDLSDVVSTLRGGPGTKLTLTIVRGHTTIKKFTIARAVIKVQSIVDAKILQDSIGYVKVTEFQERTAEDLHRALKDLEREGMNALILDLRDNPGGLLVSAIEVADLFIPGGRVIVSTKGRRKTQNQEYRSRDERTHPPYPLAVLINKGSANASEIVAGAMKDLKRGVLVGEKTSGHGTVQSILRLRPGAGAIRLTTAKYSTPGGADIQDKGIEPHVVVTETPEQEMRRRTQRYRQMEKVLQEAKDQTPETETEKPSPLPKDIEELTGKTRDDKELVDIQLQEAVDILKALKALGTDKMPAVSAENVPG